MFSHLNDLKELGIRGNTCVYKDGLSTVTSTAAMEKELWGCGYWYLLENHCQSKLELLAELVDRNEKNALELRKFVNDL
jgi:hypothetical protein